MQITVNGETIPTEVFQQELQNTSKQNPNIKEEDIKQITVHRIVDWTIIRQEATKQDIPVWGGEVDAEFEKMCQANGGKDEFFKRFNMTGKDETRIKADIETNLKTQRFLDLITKDVEQPSDDAISSFYEENKTRYIKPESAHVQHIVKQPKSDKEAFDATQELADVRQQILGGADFMELANAHSQCNDESPDLGTFMRGQMAPAFECVVFSMNENEVSPVFQTQFGFHVAKVLKKNPPMQATLEECREDVTNRIYQGERNQVIGKWVSEKKETAEIEVKEA